jgi:hypothetical protein
MDGTAAINHNLEALKRILAGLVAMAGLGGLSSSLAGEDGSARRGNLSTEAQRAKAEAEPLAEPGEGSGSRATLPRHLYLAILRLLRPAESAARRLIIAAAKGLVVPPLAPRKFSPKPASSEPFLRRFGIAVVVPPADLAHAAAARRAARCSTLCLPLFDPPRRLLSRGNRRYVPAHAAPRILFPGVIQPFSLPPPPSPNDPIDAARLSLRLAALGAALDDVPGQAKRFARWKAARDAAGAQSKDRDAAGAQSKDRDAARKAPAAARIRRVSPLRPGRPPGSRLARYDPAVTHPRKIREVDEILAHAHALAVYALQSPDTS